jgi:hypothetical protein
MALRHDGIAIFLSASSLIFPNLVPTAGENFAVILEHANRNISRFKLTLLANDDALHAQGWLAQSELINSDAALAKASLPSREQERS